MANNNEVALGILWLTSTLSGDATLLGYCPGNVWRGLAPPSTTSPYVMLLFQPGGADLVVFGGGRASADMHFHVLAVGPAKGTAALVNAAARIDVLINGAKNVAITGGTVQGCFRTEPLEMDQLIDGEEWTALGGLYRTFIVSS